MSRHPLDISTDHLIRGEHEESRAILVRLAAENPDDLRVKFNFGWHLCREGRWKEAADYLDAGRWLNCYGAARLRNGTAMWQGEPLTGKTMHLRCEGGYGDEIINVRFVNDLMALGAKVVVSCSPSLASLFSRIATAVVSFQGAEYVHADFWFPAMSSMGRFPVSGEPYLTPPPARAEKWRRLTNTRGLKIGIRWAGSPEFENQQHRLFSSDLMLDLAGSFPEATFYSFQRDNNLVDLPEGIVDFRDLLADFDDTAAALDRMDLVISSCTSVAHLAAALGKPTWVIVPVMPYFCWAMPGSKSPWYDSVRIFRQPTYGDWTLPFDEIRALLSEMIGARLAA